MKKIQTLLALLALVFALTTNAQTHMNTENFHGAEATLPEYKALFIVNHSDDKKIKGLFRNINNALADPRLKGKLQVELLAFGNGTAIYEKENRYDTLLLALKNKGVILAQCENTIRERHIDKGNLWPFIFYVPSASGEIIIRQAQGWALVHS